MVIDDNYLHSPGVDEEKRLSVLRSVTFLTVAPRASAREPATIEKGLFFRCGVTPQGGVAVRKASEARDNVLVDVDISQRLIVERDAQLDDSALIVKILGVLEGKIEEHAHVLFDLQVETAFNSDPCKPQRQLVGGKHMAGVAVTVSWKLIEQHHQGQRSLSCLDPIVQLAGCRRKVQGLETPAEVIVEDRVLHEPSLDACVTPEDIDRSDARIDCEAFSCGHVAGK
jgi:hypothetical protein